VRARVDEPAVVEAGSIFCRCMSQKSMFLTPSMDTSTGPVDNGMRLRQFGSMMKPSLFTTEHGHHGLFVNVALSALKAARSDNEAQALGKRQAHLSLKPLAFFLAHLRLGHIFCCTHDILSRARRSGMRQQTSAMQVSEQVGDPVGAAVS
jgi:hypothetical protein